MPEIGQLPGQGAPWGDIVKVETPFTDRVTAQLLAQQADRRKYQQETAQEANNTVIKELANVRSIDTPDITDAYSQWKSISSQMLRPAAQSNPKMFNDLQQQSNAALGQTMSLINRSKQLNDFGKQVATNLQTRADAHADDAGKKLSAFYNTPMDQVQQANYNGQPTDLTDAETYRFQGGNFDFSKLHNSAVGKPVTHYDDGTTDATGVQTTQHGYQFGNTPAQYRNIYLGGLAANEANRAARYKWTQHTQQELDSLDAAYQSSPNWQKLGIAPQPLPPYNPNDPVGNEATYQAKQYLASMNPAEVKAATQTNQGAKLQMQQGLILNRQKIMEALTTGDKAYLLGVGHDFKKADANERDAVMNNVVDGMLVAAKARKPIPYYPASGAPIRQYEIPASTILKKEFSVPDEKGHPILVDAFRLSEDGQTVTPIFYQSGQTGTGPNKAVDVNYSKPMTIGEFKARAAKAMFGVKEAGKENSTTPSGLSKNAFD